MNPKPKVVGLGTHGTESASR